MFVAITSLGIINFTCALLTRKYTPFEFTPPLARAGNVLQRYFPIIRPLVTPSTVLLECFAGEKPLRMSQISRKFDHLLLRSGKDRVYLLVGFADFIVAN